MNDAKLIALTTPLDKSMGDAGEFVAYCARVSNPSNQLNHETSDRLLKYLVKNKHWSPFEMVHATMEINTTRDIARQILRHRSFSFQEFSQRYADPTSDLGFVTDREARGQDTKNRQNSIEVDPLSPLSLMFQYKQESIVTRAKEAYEWAVNNGIAKEQARCFLPEGLTVSRMYMSGSLRSWIHYCDLRMGNGTQKEHKEVAINCWKELTKYFSYLTEVVNKEG